MEIADRLDAVRRRIAAACAAAGRAPDSVRLIAVSKGQGVLAIERTLSHGQSDFGESYLQEALPKLEKIPREGLVWHFIGPVQSNKTRDIAENFDWVHGLDRLRIAQRLSDQRPAWLPPLEVCVQVNISGEHSKSGCAPAEALALCRAIALLPRLRLRGLMTIPAPAGDAATGAPFRALRELQAHIAASGLELDMLSMGMSDDYEAAIAEGATLVRVGTAIFGPRA